MDTTGERLRQVRWRLVVAGFITAYLIGLLGATVLKGLGWWENGGAWERAALVWAQGTVSVWLDPFFLIMPIFGTNYTLVPLVALAAFWLWRPPAWIGSLLITLLGAVIGAGSIQVVYAFVLVQPAPGWLLALGTAVGAVAVYRLDHRRIDRPARPVVAGHLAVAQIGSWILNPALKFSVNRPRPTLFEQRGQHDFPAYPSGHSIAVTAVMFTAAYLIHRTGHGRWGYWVVGVFFVLNSYSRVYLSVHWPTDMVGGTAVGLLWLVALILAFRPAHESGRAHGSGRTRGGGR